MDKLEIKLPIVKDFTSKLFVNRRLPSCYLPVKNEVQTFVNDLLGILFPHYSKKIYYSEDEIRAELTLLKTYLIRVLSPLCKTNGFEYDAKQLADNFFNDLPEIHNNLLLDAEAITEGDPAAINSDEVILTYPGFIGIAIYRFANEFYKSGVPLFPRLLTEYAHQLTGIDIHPGATIGNSFCIDHGTGIVIGETTEIGNNVKIYQGVTLGGLSVDKKHSNKKRHPSIEDDVVIYAGATILGGTTTIGKGSVIGGNVWLTDSVPPYSVVYHKSEVRVKNSLEMTDEPMNFVI